ncbi:hypothetical protein PENANT_c029G05101 [Penicillium antarcticum]|uniref:Homeobox domain-containing protein n=1 Tax=Penicillium antarcticum TaxID=416450 RepID=A0A1V6PVX8_9EURO|nr:uncharacterized protein N7508_001683 [Penicillium antarcticum]KAJ5317175.1 hypothetical protein N7508_001683 [Penicillium antarcticum]OQD81179.1 hypothetical protein PENANT_c029G05101 [Penicillium antarcticum]
MSQPREEDPDMAISYASQPPAGSQTLPSFRELLPAHLHDEIESTSSYYTPPRTQDRPGSGHDMDPRSIPGYSPHAKMPYDAHREYTVSRGDHSRHMADPAHHMRLESSTRGPSPILPPIRDLDSMPGRNMNTQPGSASGKSYPEHGPAPGSIPPPRSDPFGQEYRAGAPMPDRRSEAYPHQAMMHPGSPYGHAHPGMGYGDEGVPQMMAHGQANFGIMGDPIDPKTKRRRGNLPKPVTDILRAWFHEHLDHPYPSEEDKQMFMTRTGLSISQISNWFINARRRQLPALRNQMRTGDVDSSRQSPFSDADGSEHLASPHH